MIEVEDMVCNLEYAGQLKEIGVKQDTHFNYHKILHSTGDYIDVLSRWEYIRLVLSDRKKEWMIQKICSAYTDTELLDMLPSEITINNCRYFLHITKTKKTEHFRLPDYYVGYRTLSDDYFISKRDDVFANALAETVVYLVKNNLIES